MKTWLDDLTETQLEVLRTSVRCAIDADKLRGQTKLNAQQVLAEIEEHLWSSVCRGTPDHSDQRQTDWL